MAMLDSLRNMLAQYTSGTAPAHEAEAHFQQVAQTADPGTLAHGIAAAMRSDQTPPFAQMISHLFANGSADQKAGMLNALLSALSPDQRAQLTALLPGAGSGAAAISGNQAAAVPAETVAAVAQKAEQHNPAIVDTMSSFYAQHPTLVKTLGTAAMMIALRKIGERQA